MKFTLEAQHGEARAGLLRRGDWEIPTPVFMPVGTLAAVKGVDTQDLANMGARMMLANAYHLMLRPGAEEVRALGGLRHWMGYPGAILTDSGGFQVFSLASLRKVTEDGVRFRSHLDGSTWNLTPERLTQVQECLMPDIAMVLDECPAGGADKKTVAQATDRSTRWAARCLEARSSESKVSWFGIVQGGIHEDLRAAHVEAISAMPFAGWAIGGVSVGENAEDIARIVAFTAPKLPVHAPRYLMGVGKPEDLVRGVAAGVDMFDCVLPTRNARNGQLFTMNGRVQIKNAAHRRAQIPVEDGCDCVCCTTTTRAYLRHLFATQELSYYRLASIHNLRFYMRLMQEIRKEIVAGCFAPEGWLEVLTRRI